MPSRYTLRVHAGRRDLERFPTDDDALGESLFGLLKKAVPKGLPRPAMLVLEPEMIRQYDIVPVLPAPARERERMFSAISSQAGAECAVLAGALTTRPAGPKSGDGPVRRAIVVYVEWPDNRWWTAWQALDPERALVGEGPVIRRAVDGWPRPAGMGGWFARARREKLTLRLEQPGRQRGLDLVH
jgi:hypothetical protein